MHSPIVIDDPSHLDFFSLLDLFSHSESSKEYLWVTPNFYLRTDTYTQGNRVYLNLNPIDKSPKNSSLNPNISISLEKDFNLESDIGWNWHKSWIIPSITVIFSNIEKFSLEKNKIFARLYSVKAGLNEINNFCLIDIGLEGVEDVFFENSIAILKNLKFNSTSYINQGLKFHLLLVIFKLEENLITQNKNFIILDSKLSAPIYVDSRKRARENQILTGVNNWFQPNDIEKEIIFKKRIGNNFKEIPIANNIIGFFNYYSEANIRRKIKNPLFAIFKFSNCVKLFFNKIIFKNIKQENIFEKIILLICKNDEKKLCKKKRRKNSKIVINSFSENAYLTIFLKDANDTKIGKKILEYLCSFESLQINVILDEKIKITDFFEEIYDLNAFLSIYVNLYEKNFQENKFFSYEDEELNKVTMNKNYFSNCIILNEQKKHKIEEIPAFLPKNISFEEMNLQFNNSLFNRNFNNYGFYYPFSFGANLWNNFNGFYNF